MMNLLLQFSLWNIVYSLLCLVTLECTGVNDLLATKWWFACVARCTFSFLVFKINFKHFFIFDCMTSCNFWDVFVSLKGHRLSWNVSLNSGFIEWTFQCLFIILEIIGSFLFMVLDKEFFITFCVTRNLYYYFFFFSQQVFLINIIYLLFQDVLFIESCFSFYEFLLNICMKLSTWKKKKT